MAYKIIFEKPAVKFIKKLSGKNLLRVRKAITELSNNPYDVSNVKKLKGYKNIYRKRVGDIRIIFRVRDSILLIAIITIGYRGDVYRND
ncbi:type II toxin-antitoxin system RelE/ParE family toxin [Sporolactobacillus sp. THM7-7]|nr:type II toxin-antitoxin system RelE/ParE family toxin [Sporolactobacillus sp. THM7-7]